jgi:hypothetical protein
MNTQGKIKKLAETIAAGGCVGACQHQNGCYHCFGLRVFETLQLRGEPRFPGSATLERRSKFTKKWRDRHESM